MPNGGRFTPDDPRWSEYDACPGCRAGAGRPCRVLSATRTWPNGTTAEWQPRGGRFDRVARGPHPGRRKTEPWAYQRGLRAERMGLR